MTTALPARQRRTHSTDFKTELVTLCCQPGVSVAAIAQAHGVNANLLRRWMKQYPVNAKLPATPVPSNLVPVQIEASHIASADGEIQFDIHRGATHIQIRWPMAGAEACSQLLAAWLK